MIRLIFLLLLFCILMPVMAQDEPTRLNYGQVATGRLDNRTPRTVYAFEGLRGEYVSVRLAATGGTLDPVLVILNQNGGVLAHRDDAQGSKNAIIETLRIPASGTYQVIVGRFGYGQGTTDGGYELVVERQGVSFESGSALRYGDTVVNTINNDKPEVYYSFRAERGDVVTLTMRRDFGNLDPVLKIVNSQLTIVAQNDDAIGTDSRIENFIVQESGTYVIVATRYLDTTGSFLLTLQRADDSGEGVSPQVAIPLYPNQPAQGELTEDRYLLYYTFTARRDDIITLRMSRVSGTIDTFLALTNAGLQELISNDDSNNSQNSEVAEYRIPADGVYYVIATRYEREAGTTIGRFRLELVTRGNVFDAAVGGAGRINYGMSVSGVINDDPAQALYAFYGVEGDRITSTLTRLDGDLIPLLTVLDESRTPLATGTSIEGSPGTQRITSYTLPRTGLYYLRVSRPDGSLTTGGYMLVLAQRFS
jgi:hypothetical protein